MHSISGEGGIPDTEMYNVPEQGHADAYMVKFGLLITNGLS